MPTLFSGVASIWSSQWSRSCRAAAARRGAFFGFFFNARTGDASAIAVVASGATARVDFTVTGESNVHAAAVLSQSTTDVTRTPFGTIITR
ncbi:MAG: hypothetical protein QM754_10850 [Tepidisphaeraceae bacterium]